MSNPKGKSGPLVVCLALVAAAGIGWLAFQKQQADQVEEESRKAIENIAQNQPPQVTPSQQEPQAELKEAPKTGELLPKGPPDLGEISEKEQEKYSHIPMRSGRKILKTVLNEKHERYLFEYTDQKIAKSEKQPAVEKKAPYNWTLKLEAGVSGSPIHRDGELVFFTYDKRIYKINEQGELVDQSRLWYQPISSPILYGENLIFPQRNGNITAKTFKGFKLLWRNHSDEGRPASEGLDISISGAKLLGGHVYLSKHWGNLYVLSADNGSLIEAPGVPYESRIPTPAIDNGFHIIFSNVGGELHGIHKSTHKKEWSVELQNGYATSLATVGSNLAVTTSEKKLQYLTPKGELIWEKNLKGFSFNSIWANPEYIYVGANSLYCFKADTGEQVWEIKTSKPWGFCRNPLTVDGSGMAYALSHEGRLIHLNMKDGSVTKTQNLAKSSAEQFWNPMLKVGKYLYISNNQKELSQLSL